MIIFYDPNNGNQVMAVYSHNTESKVWANRGYLVGMVKDPELQRSVNRDTVVEVVRGEVVLVFARTNAIQPSPDPKTVRIGELESKLATSELTNAELNELTRLDRRL